MKRRNFVNGLSALFFGTNLIKAPDSSPGVETLLKTPLDNSPIVLGPESSFTLPDNPKLLETIYFSPGHHNWQSISPIVRSNNHPIMGKKEALLVDANIPFGLRYTDPKSGWIFLKLT